MSPAKCNLAVSAESTGNNRHDYSPVYHDTAGNFRQDFKLLPLVPDDLWLRQTDRNLFYYR